MLCKDLIKVLEQMIEDNKPHEHILGPATIEIDVFGKTDPDDPNCRTFKYLGFDHDVTITKTADGVYSVLTAFDSKENTR